jgi:dipeptidyl aminopeptidase/acylaminoacyl peptidase
MKKFIVILLFGLIAIPAFAQKPVIDTSIYGKWPMGGGLHSISNDGKYVWYTIGRKVFIQAIDNNWKRKVADGYTQVFFADNSRLVIYQKGKDTLCLQTLGSNQVKYISNVNTFQISKDGDCNWLACQLHSPAKELLLRNLETGNEQSFTEVTGYQFNSGESAILLEQQNADSTLSLSWVNLASGNVTSIWTGKPADQLTFSPDGNALAFMANTSTDEKAIWCYKAGEPKAVKLFAEYSTLNNQNLKIDYLIGYSSAGDKLFFTMKQTITKPKASPNLASVDIYSYKDAKLQSQQLNDLQQNAIDYTYTFTIADHKLVQLTQKGENLLGDFEKSGKKDFILVEKNKGGDIGEWNWNPASRYAIYLISTSNGSRTLIAKNESHPYLYSLSPGNKYVVYYDAVQKNYFSYFIATGITKNITKGIKVEWLGGARGVDEPDFAYAVNPFYRWFKDDTLVLIESQNDIIQADPSGKAPAINLTGGYGQTHHTKFSLAKVDGNIEGELDPSQPFLLQAFNQLTKGIAFCKVTPGRRNNVAGMKTIPYHAEYLQKARDAEVYMVMLSNAENSPNLFLTTDFKTYQPLTDVHPERAYNWLTAELVNWKKPDGRNAQGILYKPENFDPKKKYPVIFFYYEKKSDGLHNFMQPAYADGEIDIPTYVSNGYLVFQPDIEYKIGYPGRSACNAVVSAAQYLGKFPWVDTKHMGLVGHSFGGFETNYIITHSHLFAAAVSTSGQTDFVSGYDYLNGGVGGRQAVYELGQSRIGATLWQRPDLFIENSAVLHADQVTTPVLLMANKKDGVVPFEQGIEFFLALRRLQKKAWLLQYDHGGHMADGEGDDSGADDKDFTIRSRQFFDYYLEGKTPPKWMTEGIPASMKQIDNGFEPDNSGKQP